MTHFLPDLYEGHAPITLQHLFRDAIHAFDDWSNGDPEPAVMHEGRLVPIGAVFNAMRDCTDVAPRALIEIVTDHLTRRFENDDALDRVRFSTTARIMTVLLRKRRLHGKAAMVAFMDRHHPQSGKHG